MRRSDGDSVEIQWTRGEDPRFELVGGDGVVLKKFPLARKTVAQIEEMLAEHGYEPKKKVD